MKQFNVKFGCRNCGSKFDRSYPVDRDVVYEDGCVISKPRHGESRCKTLHPSDRPYAVYVRCEWCNSLNVFVTERRPHTVEPEKPQPQCRDYVVLGTLNAIIQDQTEIRCKQYWKGTGHLDSRMREAFDIMIKASDSISFIRDRVAAGIKN